MAWALVDHDMWGVTARMSVEFKRPVPIGRRIRAEGRVIQVRRRLVEAEGVILDSADGALLARAHATFVGAPDDRKQELKARYGFREAPEEPTVPEVREGPEVPEVPPGARGAGEYRRSRHARHRGPGPMTVADDARQPSATTARARALVAERLPDAVALGRATGDVAPDPAAAVEILRRGLAGLADPEYLEGQQRIAPGIGPVLGVRGPLLHAVSRGLRATTRHDPSSADPRPRRPDARASRPSSSTGSPSTSSSAPSSRSRSAPGSWSGPRPARPPTGSRWTRSPTWRAAASSPSPTGGRSWSSSSTRRRAGSAGSSARPSPRSRSSTAPRAARRTSPATASPSSATSSATPSPTCRRRSPGRCATWRWWTSPATVAFLRTETARAAATADGHRAWVIRDTLRQAARTRRRRAGSRPRGHPEAPRRPIDVPRLGDRRRLPGSRPRHPAGRAPHRPPIRTIRTP